MNQPLCPDCGARLIDDASENIIEREDGTLVIDAFPALVCEQGCGYTERIQEFPKIIAQQDEDRLLLLYPDDQGRILDLRDQILHPPIHYLSILGRGYWEDYTGNHDVQTLLDQVYDSEAPNLFTYATSELSQDAFLCWLLSWSEKKYRSSHPSLHRVAVEFVSTIFTAHNRTMPEIDTLKIIPQFKSLDILAIVNETYAIMIEDKTFTKNHSNQLNRYRDAVKKKYPDLIQLPIYYKIADQSNYRSVEAAQYIPFTRKMMLDVLEKGRGIKNAIFLDYYWHIQRLENAVSAYRFTPVTKWNALAWQGFYQELQKELGGDWGYVANPRGGFWGFWWKQNPNKKYYYQLEQRKLCVKVVAKEEENKRELRNEIMKKILERSAEEDLHLKKPARVRNGRTMTVAERQDYIVTNEAGLVDLASTIAELKKL
ncbi:PD-(D/E)XK nuclease family protein [Siminovitchia sediminis]|uniref:PD-(D/E)XK nuclease family protein n=1 Tax=Siminovitchia sediminis TaxID=1274353 RepID=A0ABW4KL69_9BACI